jgi:hypothetical protein
MHLCSGAGAATVAGCDDDEWAATRGHTKDAGVGPGTSAYGIGTTGLGHFVLQIWQTTNIPSMGFFSGAVGVVASFLLHGSAVLTSHAATKAVGPDASDTKSSRWEDKNTTRY